MLTFLTILNSVVMCGSLFALHRIVEQMKESGNTGWSSPLVMPGCVCVLAMMASMFSVLVFLFMLVPPT